MKKKRHEIVDLLRDLRAEGIRCSHITVGAVTLDGVVDTKLDVDVPAKKAEPRKSMFEQYAGDLIQKPATPVDVVPEEAMLDD